MFFKVYEAEVANAISMNRVSATAKAPGTCGELVQGTLEGKPFLVTCPVALWSEVTVRDPCIDVASCNAPKNLHSSVIEADHASKMKQAIQEVWKKAELRINHSPLTGPEFSRRSNIPVGKGMSSSTADIAAAGMATARFLGIELTPEEVSTLALSIEPSDGIMFPGIHLLDHLYGRWSEPLGVPPSMEVLILDPGGVVDTMAFNRRKGLCSLNRQKEPEVKKALQLVREGVEEKDPEKIGRGATISAQANQKILFKKDLGKVIRLSRELKALGVNVAHSGTVLGILLPPSKGKAEEAAAWISSRFPQASVRAVSLVSGGIMS